MSIRGKVAIVGIGEIPTRRAIAGRSNFGLAAEATKLALDDAQLRKEDINGLITDEYPAGLAEYIGIRPRFATGLQMGGATGAVTVQVAASAIAAGYCDTVLCVISWERQPSGYSPPDIVAGSVREEFEDPYGTAPGANTGYGLLYQRHMYEFGTKPEQLARIAVNQRFNALANPNAVFQGPLITVEDVLSSRYVNEPLHLLECVMPCAGAAACIVTTPERAKALPNRPAYLLGAGIEVTHFAIWQLERMTTSPTKVSAANALRMAGYTPKDMQFAEFYD